MPVELRALASSDRTKIEAVLRSDATFRDGEVAVALELVDDALENDQKDYWFRVAADGDQVAGYICYGPTPMTDATYDLYWIVVDKAFRGHGLARRLIDAMESDLRERGATGIRVETEQTEEYSAARKLYERCDYPLAACLSDFYRAGEDLLIYYKTL